ncbi:MAG: hypothetical protein CVU59_07865 [Deltaproteobacteria bacterium HGW-Deltaproteobacteria-17]|nr:MAG: hypothetical protein CVU59_07865 [Deltaproteobacteria bacterium HGW-Deltaproteobacteria-17]
MYLIGNKMDYYSFRTEFLPLGLFSLAEVVNLHPGFHRNQLDRWEDKGYLRRLRRGVWAFPERLGDERFLWLAANRLYGPSYLSLQKALKFHGLIPEEVFLLTSVCTRKTATFETPVGTFDYRHLKPELFWGYRWLDWEDRRIRIAEPEKAVLDLLYLNPGLCTADDFASLRFDAGTFLKLSDPARFTVWAYAFGSRALARRAAAFLEYVHHDSSLTSA